MPFPPINSSLLSIQAFPLTSLHVCVSFLPPPQVVLGPGLDPQWVGGWVGSASLLIVTVINISEAGSWDTENLCSAYFHLLAISVHLSRRLSFSFSSSFATFSLNIPLFARCKQSKPRGALLKLFCVCSPNSPPLALVSFLDLCPLSLSHSLFLLFPVSILFFVPLTYLPLHIPSLCDLITRPLFKAPYYQALEHGVKSSLSAF